MKVGRIPTVLAVYCSSILLLEFMGIFKKLFDTPIPRGVRILTYATAIRWIGWGFAESLLPVFIFSFGNTYAEAGLLRSVYDIVFILALPVVGMAADRFRATSLILIGLALYPLVGISYFFAGITGVALFIVFARGLNGLTYAFDAVGRETYFRRHDSPKTLATIFGYFDSISNFWWVAAALAGMILIKYFSIPVLLLMIAPTSVIAFLLVWSFRKNEESIEKPGVQGKLRRAYREAWYEIGKWNWQLKGVAMFNFFIAFSSAVVAFFLPIEVYNDGAGYGKTILVGVMFALPYLLGWILGKWFDVKGLKTFFYGLAGFTFLFASLAVVDAYWWKVVAAFCIGIVIELLSVGNNELITVYSQPEHFGRVSGVMRSIYDMGSLIGPLIIGILIDSQGTRMSFFLLACLMGILSLVFYSMRGKMGLLEQETSIPGLHKKLHRF